MKEKGTRVKIEIDNVSFAYPGTKKGALKNVSLKIAEGECILFTGASGCGKTTVTRMVNGLIPAFFQGELSGNVRIDGREVRNFKSYELSQIVGSVFQNPRTQFFNVDTDSEIVFGLENAGLGTVQINRTLETVTQELGLHKLRGRDIFQLSGGEKQKIAFASVYAMSPDIFVLDEPSSNLDAEGVMELAGCLRQVKAEGKTILVAEHRLYYLMDIADHIVYMKDGGIDAVWAKEEFAKFSYKELAGLGLRASRLSYIVRKEKKWLHAEKSGHKLELSHLSAFRKGEVVFSGLDLSLYAGQILGIVGKNGAGKTTLLRTIAGLHKDYEGQIFFDGQAMRARELRRKSYLIMQDVNYQLFADSVMAECTLGLKKTDSTNAEAALAEMGLAEYKDRHPNTLSGGQKQRLAVAVSMVCGKEILLFDEPTSGLDYENMARMARVLRQLAEAGKLVIVVTHDEEFLAECCTEIVSL